MKGVLVCLYVVDYFLVYKLFLSLRKVDRDVVLLYNKYFMKYSYMMAPCL